MAHTSGNHRQPFLINSQPDNTSCGPTCLQAVYRYFGLDLDLGDIIREVPSLDEGGTLAVMLGRHALERGFDALIYTFNLQVFDPTWFSSSTMADLRERLRAQMDVKSNPKLRMACQSYIDFLSEGGIIRMQDLNSALIRKYLQHSVPMITGLSSTYLYQESREIGEGCIPDDLRGEPTGHFVVLCGYDALERTVQVADPYLPNPIARHHYYEVPLSRAICSILLGIVTYDANLLIIRRRE